MADNSFRKNYYTNLDLYKQTKRMRKEGNRKIPAYMESDSLRRVFYWYRKWKNIPDASCAFANCSYRFMVRQYPDMLEHYKRHFPKK